MRNKNKEFPINNSEFQFYKLNENGLDECEQVARLFDDFLADLEHTLSHKGDPRCIAIVKTKLEEACFFAKKAAALKLDNQLNEEGKNENNN